MDNSTFGVPFSWWGHLVVGSGLRIDAFVGIYLEPQAVVKSMEPDESPSNNTSLTPLAQARWRMNGIKTTALK